MVAVVTTDAVFLAVMTQFCGLSFFSCLFSATMVAVTLAYLTTAVAVAKTNAANLKKQKHPPLSTAGVFIYLKLKEYLFS